MLLRRYAKQWVGESPVACAISVAPGAHDLLAADAVHGERVHSGAVERRPSVSLQVKHSDLAVGESDFHVLEE